MFQDSKKTTIHGDEVVCCSATQHFDKTEYKTLNGMACFLIRPFYYKLKEHCIYPCKEYIDTVDSLAKVIKKVLYQEAKSQPHQGEQ